ncbi:serine hydrolase domain-containing protein [Chondrinema litorale]|uniref:serine hydrolase domain-containing protein n=1 Tax=Chondrinema litorale TaxID=2994555 RepID=UPI0025435EBD|nr:serine hydrolase domain-containing protein [Chondrinema litorale]UZR93636.1 serine hydrolase [Chondrinema litorale]
MVSSIKQLTITILIFFTLTVQAQPVEKLNYLFENFQSKNNFSGNVYVSVNGKALYNKSTGIANHEFSISVDEDTRFDIASISKQFTAALILKYWEDGLIDLDAPISEYLPYYRSDIGKFVTVSQLLTHQSGIPNYTSLPGVWIDSLRNHYSFKYLIQHFCSGNLEFEPGSKFSYNNSGYVLLAGIIEEISGRSFENEIQEKILNKLGLENTGISSREQIISNKAYGYDVLFDEWQNANYTYMPNLNGAGSMYSTVKDLTKWTLALHNGKVLSKKAYELMFQPYAVDNDWIPPYKNAYGYGIGMLNTRKIIPEELDGWNMYFHSGHISGFSSFLAYYPEDQKIVVLLSNTDGIRTVNMNDLTISMIEAIEEFSEVSSGK